MNSQIFDSTTKNLNFMQRGAWTPPQKGERSWPREPDPRAGVVGRGAVRFFIQHKFRLQNILEAIILMVLERRHPRQVPLSQNYQKSNYCFLQPMRTAWGTCCPIGAQIVRSIRELAVILLSRQIQDGEG